MALEIVGGGTSAVASSAHASCARFRGTDPLITGLTRRNLAKSVGFPDSSGAIPQARWMRAMTFERLVRNEAFAGQVATRTVGELGLARPDEVVTVDAHTSVDTTAWALTTAHDRATQDGIVTLIFQLAVPFIGFESTRATDVRPDFAVVAPSMTDPGTSLLIMGDAKDYERVRSRIDDARMLKGFLQVAVGAESAQAWSKLPRGMTVSTYGVLAVPRNAFLQPVPVVEQLDDYADEVRLRINERRREAEESGYRADGYTTEDEIAEFVEHLEASFDPARCVTCELFSYCRTELRRSTNPADLLIELGVSRNLRTQALSLVDVEAQPGRVPASLAANVTATISGVAQLTGQLRVDQAGLPGTVNIVLAKSDAAALGVHGLGLQRVAQDGRGRWEFTVFTDPQSAETRRTVMRRIGTALTAAMRDQRRAAQGEVPAPIHLVAPDQATADLLVSMADNLAGIELSRLRWERDLAQGRPALTYDGEPAVIPRALNEKQRTAIAFLLEDDRARGFQLRSPVIDVRAALARHVVPGGPLVNAGRLDYLVGWAETTGTSPVEHRAFADAIEASEHTPGARLTNTVSDAIHIALVGERGKPADAPVADAQLYESLVHDELRYKADVLERALDALASFPASMLRPAYRAIESDAQEVWRRRLNLHASDLVRFGRTYRHWRNSLVDMLESDGTCSAQLLALSNPQVAQDLAVDAGNRHVATATVVSTSPLVLEVDSRRIIAGSRIVLLARNGTPCAEEPGIALTIQKGSFKLDGLSIGPLQATSADAPKRLEWAPYTAPALTEGDDLVIADFAWFSGLTRNRFLTVDKPKADAMSAPRPDCTPDTYDDDPQGHRWCCRSHESNEADFSDELAARRARGELNPETWPPVRDLDGFEVTASGSAEADAFATAPETVPAGLTLDELE